MKGKTQIQRYEKQRKCQEQKRLAFVRADFARRQVALRHLRLAQAKG